MQVDLQEFRDAYLAEVEEHLAGARACLVEGEKAAREGRPCPRELRELMRLLHTIKGLSSMVGIEPIVVLSHRMETVVRDADRAGGFMSERTLEALASGARALEAQVRAVEAGAAVPEAPKGLFDGLEEPPARTTPMSSPLLDAELEAKLSASEREQIGQAAAEGKRVLRIEFGPSPQKAAEGLTITSVRERAKPLGDTVKVVPLSRAASPEAPSGLLFVVVLVTTETDEAVARAIGIPVTDIVSLVTATALVPEVAVSAASSFSDDAVELRSGVLRVEVSRVDDALEKLSALLVTRSRLGHAAAKLEGPGVRELVSVLADNARQLRDLRGAILRLRMIPVAQVLDRLPLVVRGLGRTTGKDVRLILHAEGAELDKTVAERLFPAIVHLLRNAVDHGLESPDERVAAGKPSFGTIRIRCVADSNRRLDLRIEDDGRGVDRARVAAKAGRDAAIDDATLLEIMCRPGFSTRDVVDTTSGRGVGMDIVKKVLDALGGELLLETDPGRGTTFTLRVPLTIAIVDAFTIRCGDQRYVVPVSVVDEIVEVDPKAIVRGPGTRIFARRGEPIAIVGLEESLAGTPESANEVRLALVVRRGRGEVIAFSIDRVLGQQETVVRPLVDPLVRAPGVSGTADLGDGRATLVLDLVAVAARLEERAA